MKKNLETIVLGGGCFWCIEAVFQNLKGVETVVSGYAGGDTDNPRYEEVCSGKTGHAEVVKIDFDKTEIKLEEILDMFFRAHDPKSLNRQGADVGTQYRSVIFYQNDEHKKLIDRKIKDLGEGIVTEVKPLRKFYPAENYHQNYFIKNQGAPYCTVVIEPKLKKLFK
ncbi:peptide-methionine (S)-S-oxide reductase MsrA [Candidatus Peregrinibacteria bacterium]|nr:peptide-methionine (S)-S-oxide reductase MsrA [Candidatus Peregrinibacteria bacterium]